jgi:hypothetical protein
MLAPDYQDFANRERAGHRDNTVIFGIRMGITCRNRPTSRDCHAANRHESGTFCLSTGITAPPTPKFAGSAVNVNMASMIP